MAIKIMVVEDDFIIRMFIEKVVESAGFKLVAKASSYDEALYFANLSKPEIILMDIGLSSKKDGIEAAEEILKVQEVKIIYLTGNSDENTIERANKTNPIGIIRKPINEELLISELKKYVANYFD